MANWHFEERMMTGGPFPLLLMVGDNGVEARMDFTRGWHGEYNNADLYVRFSVYRDPPLKGDDRDKVLGPHCFVSIDRSRLSRPLEPKDCETLAINLKEVLRMHVQIPGAVPPKIERIRFWDPELQPFDD